uniref:Uncharacterized protein n=1 Tax=Rhizophagus irregularis (strain DAOM 181602 / DAOM 197198 / MUCL 43194) TaxID=747089 RepID=U9TWS2_RHIID
MDKKNKEKEQEQQEQIQQRQQEQKAPASYQNSDFGPSDSGSSYESQKKRINKYKYKCEFHNESSFIMSREEDVERIPLLRGFGFIILATLLLLINISFYFIESNEEILTKGIPNIPYEYNLGLKSDNWIGYNKFDYVIETSPPNDPTFSNLFTNSTEDSTSQDRLKIAEIIARNHKAWNPAYYEVREERHNPHKNYTVLTTKSHMRGLWFVIWPPKVHISFTSIGDDSKNKDKNDGGSSEWGMQWLDPDRIETYGIVTKPSQGRQMRNVVIRPDSPFPPILPALYVAYFDRIINKGDPEGRTNLFF